MTGPLGAADLPAPIGAGFEDYVPGSDYEFGYASLSETEIVDFARHYDPQSIHTDPACRGIPEVLADFSQAPDAIAAVAVSTGRRRSPRAPPSPVNPREVEEMKDHGVSRTGHATCPAGLRRQRDALRPACTRDPVRRRRGPGTPGTDLVRGAAP